MIKLKKNFSTHMPVLMKALTLTDGDVLEIGVGIYSTPLMHWACFGKRKLVSYETNKEWFDMHVEYKNDLHEMYYVEDWDKADIEKPWDVVLIDHEPALRRKEDIKRLANFAKYIVVHDTEGNRDPYYKFSEIYPLFKYRFIFDKARPHTSVLSNFVDLKDFTI